MQSSGKVNVQDKGAWRDYNNAGENRPRGSGENEERVFVVFAASGDAAKRTDVVDSRPRAMTKHSHG